MYDLIIIGGGPAGAAGAVYAARKQLKTLLITADFCGQSVVSSGIQNWIGTPEISGAELAENLKKHVLAYANDVVTVKEGEKVVFIKKTTPSEVEGSRDIFSVKTDQNNNYQGKTILICAGSGRRKLEAKGADKLEHKGLTYCASCDGPLFAGMEVAVMGGGNAAFESALQLLAYCKSVTLLNRTENFRADEISIAAAKAHANMRIVLNAEPTEVVGGPSPGGFVSGIKYKDAKSVEETLLPVAGIFVEIGLLPSSAWLANVLELNAVGQIKVDPRTQRASHRRVWAAGDITDGIYHQNNIAAGDAVKALEDVYMFIR